MQNLTLEELKARLVRFPEVDLIHKPTPLIKLEYLSRELGGPQIYIKREDLGGLAFGGNKSRKLQFIIRDALDKKCNAVVTWASVQSNWCLQTAAAARKYEMTPILVLFKTYDLPDEHDGNLLLDDILGADIRIRDAEIGKLVKPKEAERVIHEVMEETRRKGYTPYYAPLGGSQSGGSMNKPLGALGYVECFGELCGQARKLHIDMDSIVHATGSGGTQAGLIAGARILGEKTRVIGISVSEGKEDFTRVVRSIEEDTFQALDLDIPVLEDDVCVFDEYIQEGYGIVNKDVADVLRLIAVKEGIFLDPVYTGKAMLGLIDLIKKGYFSKKETVIFLHTGGTPALFPNKALITSYLEMGKSLR